MPTAAEALLSTDCADLRAKIATRDAMIAGLDARVNRLNKLIVERDQEIDRLNDKLERQLKETFEADAIIAELRAGIVAPPY